MATEERLTHLDAALRDCIQQISSLQQQQHADSDLKQANKTLVSSLLSKQHRIDALERDNRRLESELAALSATHDSAEKENALLKCECCALERQLCSSKLKCAQVAYRLALLEADPSGSAEEQLDETLANQIVPISPATSTTGGCCWPWNVLDVILEQHQLSKRSIADLLREIQLSLTNQSADVHLSTSICRIIELIEEIVPPCLARTLTDDTDDFRLPTTGSNLDYLVHVFRWRTADLIPILRKFILSCSHVLSGAQGLNEFAMQLASAMEWAVQNCITLEDPSRVRDSVRKHFKLDNNRSNSETELNIDSITKMVKIQSDLQEENKLLKLKLQSAELANKQLENTLRLSVEKNEQLMNQLGESKRRIVSLQEEVEDVNESRGGMEDQIEHLKSVNEDLDTQLNVAKAKQNQMLHNLSSLEVELENKNQSCEELETTCLELQLQLEILSRNGTPYPQEEQMANNKQIGWEMISDCSKLALVMHDAYKESSDGSSEHGQEEEKRHCSLRDRMLADNDNDDEGNATKAGQRENADPDSDGNKVLAVVPMKKQGGGRFGFMRKLFVRRRKCGPRKPSTLLQRNASNVLRHK